MATLLLLQLQAHYYLSCRPYWVGTPWERAFLLDGAICLMDYNCTPAVVLCHGNGSVHHILLNVSCYGCPSAVLEHRLPAIIAASYYMIYFRSHNLIRFGYWVKVRHRPIHLY